MSSSEAPGSVRPLPIVAAMLLAVAGAILFGAFVDASSNVAAEAGVVYGLAFDRAWITVVDLLALVGAAVGVVTLTRSSREIGSGSKGAVAALAPGTKCDTAKRGSSRHIAEVRISPSEIGWSLRSSSAIVGG